MSTSIAKVPALILGGFLFAGLAALGTLLGSALIEFREYERSVVVKGLSEREVPADIVIWPIQFTEPGNDLGVLYGTLEANTARIRDFLIAQGIAAGEITVAAPSINDKSAQMYGGGEPVEFRYTASQVITVYSGSIDAVRAAMASLSELGRTGIVFNSDMYQYRPEYLFTRLNDIKPEMVEEATREARGVAEKFAADSASRLGKIKNASQGQFSISDRDTNNPHIKIVRVVTTVEYYLSD